MILRSSLRSACVVLLGAGTVPILPAYGHAFGQRYDLPIPLSLFVAGAGAAVALSFVVVAWFLRGASGQRYGRINLLRLRLGRALAHRSTLLACRLASVAAFGLIIAAGFFGNQDAFKNIAPVTVWVIGWVGLAYVSVLLGDLWALINPWKILFTWVESIYRRLRPGRELALRLAYPPRLGAWPAVMLFAALAWTELIWHERDVPAKLATLLLAYSFITWTGMAIFGKELWLCRGEALSLVFGLLARFSPTEVRVKDATLCAQCPSPSCRPAPAQCINCYACFARAPSAQREWNLRPYAIGLVSERPVSASMMALVLLMLSTVTFDGLRETPLWVSAYGALLTTPSIRSVLVDLHRAGVDVATAVDTLGLVGFPFAFFLLYMGFSGLMRLATGGALPAERLARTFVLSLIPIAIAYHLAHYLSYLLTVGQYIIPLASDPFGLGWDLLGTKLYFIRIGIVDARFVWYTAVIAIVVGHIAAVYLAHLIALDVLPSARLALRSQMPMLLLMVGYTMVSLWILAQPIVQAPAVARSCGVVLTRAEWPPPDSCLRAAYPLVQTRA